MDRTFLASLVYADTGKQDAPGVFREWAMWPFFRCGAVKRMKQDKITRLLAPLVESLGYEFVGIEHMAIPKNALVRLYIDHAEGIQVEDCVAVSREVSALMDVEDPIAGNYTLEVSSPGMDRLLFCIAHFERFVGETVKLTVLPPISGRKKFRGAIKGVKGDTVMIDQDSETIEIDHARIQKARIVPKW